jgi:hypothetical protein
MLGRCIFQRGMLTCERLAMFAVANRGPDSIDRDGERACRRRFRDWLRDYGVMLNQSGHELSHEMAVTGDDAALRWVRPTAAGATGTRTARGSPWPGFMVGVGCWPWV